MKSRKGGEGQFNKVRAKGLLILFLIIFLSGSSVYADSNDFILEYNLKRLPEPNYNLSNNEHKFYLPEFHVRGIYVTGWVAGTEEKMQELIELVDKTVLNAMVIDVKDQQGFLSYNSSVKLVKEIGANRNKIKNIKGLLNRLHNKGIYTIARLAIFKDALLAKSRPDLALPIWDPYQKKVIYSKSWVDPSKKEVWDYNVLLAREAVELGFDEIQFDYIRYPAMAKSPLEAILKENKTKSEIINSFAAYARDKLADLNVPISIDVFGLTTTVKDDLGIGQNFAQLTDIIKIISPMVYPSHYAAGSYGIEIPASQPYQIIYKSLVDARKKVINKKNVIIRPWLQDFSLGYQYSFQEVIDQIRAAESLDINEWLLWNPQSKYTKEALLNPPIN